MFPLISAFSNFPHFSLHCLFLFPLFLISSFLPIYGVFCFPLYPQQGYGLHLHSLPAFFFSLCFLYPQTVGLKYQVVFSFTYMFLDFWYLPTHTPYSYYYNNIIRYCTHAVRPICIGKPPKLWVIFLLSTYSRHEVHRRLSVIEDTICRVKVTQIATNRCNYNLLMSGHIGRVQHTTCTTNRPVSSVPYIEMERIQSFLKSGSVKTWKKYNLDIWK